jgi:hypothetical protein
MAGVLAAAALAAGGVATIAGRTSGGVDWRHHTTRSFSVDVPVGWRVRGEASGRVRIRGERSDVVIWPVFLEERLDRDASATVARKLTSKLLPDGRWRITRVGAGLVRLAGRTTNGAAVSLFAHTASSKGTAGYLYTVAAPPEAFSRSKTTFARILGSFTARGGPVRKDSGPTFEKWVDPVEGAFSVEVPQGWNVEGGTRRPTSELVQASARAESPDGRSVVLMTDELPIYVEPNDLLAMGGIYEGGTYVDPSGYPLPVRSYEPAAAYLRDHVVPARAPEATIRRLADRPELTSQLPRYGINSYDAGEVEYRFARDGVPYTGAAVCVTEVVDSQGVRRWHAWRLFLIEAPSARYEEALNAVQHLAESFQIDPQWMRQQNELIEGQSRIIGRLSQDISETLDSGYWAKQAVYDALDERRSRARLEVEDVAGENGDAYRVDSGPDYFWIDPSGTVVGTQTDTRPAVDFRQLVRLD